MSQHLWLVVIHTWMENVSTLWLWSITCCCHSHSARQCLNTVTVVNHLWLPFTQCLRMSQHYDYGQSHVAAIQTGKRISQHCNCGLSFIDGCHSHRYRESLNSLTTISTSTATEITRLNTWTFQSGILQWLFVFTVPCYEFNNNIH